MPTLSPAPTMVPPARATTSNAGAPTTVLWMADSIETADEVAQIRTFVRAADPKRIQIDLCTITGSGEGALTSELRRHAVAVHALDARGTHDPAAFLRLHSLLRRSGYDLVHTHSPWASQWGGVLGRLVGVPVVATLYGRPAESEGWGRGRNREAWVLRRWARRIMSQSGAQWDHYIREGVFSRAVLEVVYGGVEIPNGPFGEAPARRLRREWDFPDGAPVAVTVGSLHGWDSGIDTLLWAVPDILEAVPQARFVIAGDGATKTELERRTRARGLSRIVRWAREDHVEGLLAGADLFVQPSLRHAFPIEALNAMAAGLPVVGTRAGSVPEIIGSPEIGRLVPRSDPEALASVVATLLADPKGLSAMGAAARRRVLEEFSSARWIERMEKLYANVVDEVREGRPLRRRSHARLSVKLARGGLRKGPG